MPEHHGVDELVRIAASVREHARSAPFVVALDGRSGVGKSTLAGALAPLLDAAVLDGDGFFAGGIAVRLDTPSERARDCIDWRKQRPVLQSLRAGRPASYLAFDWDAFDGRLEPEPTAVEPRPIVILEGVYSARPELADLIDLRVLLRASEATRLQRLLQREGDIGPWDRQWHEAEAWYFDNAARDDWFQLIVES